MRNPFDPGYYESAELRTFGFAYVGDHVRVAKNCVIIGPQNISLGAGTRIDAGTHIIAATGSATFLGWNHIGGCCHISAAGDFEIGEFSGFSQGVRIYTATDDYSGRKMAGPCVPPHLRGPKMAPVRIGRHCIIGSGSVVLPGCHFADGAAVGALSLVTKPLREWTLYHGNPAKPIRRRHRDVLDLEKLISAEGLESAA